MNQASAGPSFVDWDRDWDSCKFGLNDGTGLGLRSLSVSYMGRDRDFGDLSPKHGTRPGLQFFCSQYLGRDRDSNYFAPNYGK